MSTPVSQFYVADTVPPKHDANSHSSSDPTSVSTHPAPEVTREERESQVLLYDIQSTDVSSVLLERLSRLPEGTTSFTRGGAFHVSYLRRCLVAPFDLRLRKKYTCFTVAEKSDDGMPSLDSATSTEASDDGMPSLEETL